MSADSSHPSQQTLLAYQARRLAPGEVLALSDHLEVCDTCRGRLAASPTAAAGSRALRFDLDHGSAAEDDATDRYEQLVACLDETRDPAERSRLAAELAATSPCAAAELADLQTFHEALAALPPKVHAPPAQTRPQVVAAPARTVVAVAAHRWRLTLPRIAAVAALFVLLLTAAWWNFARPTRRSASHLLLTDTSGQPVDVAALPAALRQQLERAARDGRLEAPALAAELRPHANTLAGSSAGEKFTQLWPVGTVVREARPSLRWTPRADATGYVVYLEPLSAGHGAVSPELPAGAVEWTPPEALTRGAIYEWQVEARNGGEVIDRAPKPPAAEARFQVLSTDEESTLGQLETHFTQAPLVLGVAYTRAGLFAAAAAQFRALAQQHPDSATARELLQQAEAAAGAQSLGSPAPTTTNGAQ